MVPFWSTHFPRYTKNKQWVPWKQIGLNLISIRLGRQLRIVRTTEDKLDRCPNCVDLAWNPHVLSCGHMLCAQCISRRKLNSLQQTRACKCPVCQTSIHQM
ncbi:MAG: hypothetical protein NXY57DRAFT_1031874 [Lentinula lateritia]|nr:MAG: hypothetical protein NXY57DRAFT_1031874 [Lentinula lateritia]